MEITNVCSAFVTIILLVQSSFSVGQIVFPGKTSSSYDKEVKIGEPVACDNSQDFCGDDPEKYPSDEINRIVKKSIELQISPETTERFFISDPPDDKDMIAVDNDVIKPSCSYRSELIPRYARAKNVFGDWVYLVEGPQNERQHVRITICEDPKSHCKNDFDSPYGEGTTICKQIFRTQKLLAMNTNGTMVVDTFKLPSACVCNHVGQGFAVGLRRFGFGSEMNPPKCNEANATQSLELNNVPPGRENDIRRLELEKPLNMSTISPCGDSSDVLCEESDEAYPEESIEEMMQSHVTFKDKNYFGAIFGDICQPPEEANVALRGGFDLHETELCTSEQRYIYPTKAKTTSGEWHYIINTDQYRQGVTIEVCLPNVRDSSCMYGGAEGHNPSGTVCKQMFAIHHMLAIKSNGTVSYEAFTIPTACTCFYNQDEEFFES